jgi:predicted lipoprotein with Yx(FWY)xxD motif
MATTLTVGGAPVARSSERLPHREAPKSQIQRRAPNLSAAGAVDRLTKSTQGSPAMRRFTMPRPTRSSIRLALLATALVALLAPAVAAAGQASKRVAKQAENASLGRTVLTTTKGRTLYSLSAETHGRFICTGACASTWHPLVVPSGVKPTGPVKLGTIERPEGKTQVTFKGLPLYSFSGDSKAGDANGEGIKDVGTWHAAITAQASPQPEPQPQPQPEPPYPY